MDSAVTLSDRVRVLLDAGFTPRHIAVHLGCSIEFVRAVRSRDKKREVTHG